MWKRKPLKTTNINSHCLICGLRPSTQWEGVHSQVLYVPITNVWSQKSEAFLKCYHLKVLPSLLFILHAMTRDFDYTLRISHLHVYMCTKYWHHYSVLGTIIDSRVVGYYPLSMMWFDITFQKPTIYIHVLYLSCKLIVILMHAPTKKCYMCQLPLTWQLWWMGILFWGWDYYVNI